MKQKVLVVDDEPDVVAALIFRLEQEDFEVHTAINGLEAFEMFRAHEPDLVLLDVMMPGGNGYRVSKLLREEEKSRGDGTRIPIILLTARDLRDDAEREEIFMDFSGADEVLYKPYELEEVVGRVLALCRADQNQEAPGSPGVILVVDDEAAVRNLVCSILSGHGYTALQAENGDEAIALVHERRGQVDVLLTDLLMPGMNGMDLVGSLAGVAPLLKAILMSGYSQEGIADRGIFSDSHAVLKKPFSAQDLIREVERAMAGIPMERAV